MLTVTTYSLTISGLLLAYTANNQQHILTFDPPATCELFEELNIIQGFDLDRNFEPVLLAEREHDYYDEETGNIAWTTRVIHIFWCDFVQSFSMIQRYAEIFCDYIESKRRHKETLQMISSLMAA